MAFRRLVGGRVRTKGMRIAAGFARGGSTSHQPSLRNRYGRDQRGVARFRMPPVSQTGREAAGRIRGGFPQARAVFVQGLRFKAGALTTILSGRWRRPSQAPFLSLRRGERWLGEAETEWGNLLATAANRHRKGTRRKHRLALRPRVDPHSVELRSTPLPRSTGERKGVPSATAAERQRAAQAFAVGSYQVRSEACLHPPQAA